ncbi:MAG: hypothetical protein FJ256_04655 [Phycisphaerae bacterium]|nr:hypothetical protein [Phycisphaerae bacterium]
MRSRWNALLQIALAVPALLAVGCNANLYDPTLATRPYPEALQQESVVQVQVVPQQTQIRFINATSTNYDNIDIWINRRFVKHVERLHAGQQIEVEIEDFRDQWGQCPQPGGFWRTRPPTPIVITQIQRDETQPLVGLVTVLPSDVKVESRDPR